jgi:hypothetical protein
MLSVAKIMPELISIRDSMTTPQIYTKKQQNLIFVSFLFGKLPIKPA